MTGLTISKAATKAGIGVETIRFYERRGLIDQPPTPPGSGVRRYSPETVERIRFIKQAQQIGFSLREIQELLALRADPSTDCSDVREQAIAKRNDIQRKIEQLQEIDAALEALIEACPACGGLQACSIMDALTLGLRRVDIRGSAAPHQSQNSQAEVRNMKAATFIIEGMHCDSCAMTVKTLVEQEPGVKAATVSFKDGEARVLYDPQVIREDRLTAVIQKPGYRVVGCR